MTKEDLDYAEGVQAVSWNTRIFMLLLDIDDLLKI